jgi:hypothetical protein
MVSRSQTSTASSSSKADTVKETRTEVSQAATTSNKVVKPMANNRVVLLMVQANMARGLMVDSNNQDTASQDMSMLAPPLHMATLSLTALLLVNNPKAMVDQGAPRKATAAS